MQKEFNKLDKIIIVLLSTHASKILSLPLAIARAFGVLFYADRYELLGKLFREFKQFPYIRMLSRAHEFIL